VFKNLMVYRIAAEWQADTATIEESLAKSVFTECGATQAQSLGWAPPRGLPHAPLVEEIAGHWLLKLLLEQKVLPGAVVRRRCEEMAEALERQTGRKPGKKQVKEMKEQATLELLPQAFTKQSSIKVWIAPAQQLLMIDAGSASRAEEVVTLLVKALDGLSLHLVQTAESPASCMSAWLMDGIAPEGFSIDRECELKSSDEMKSVVRYARHSLDIEEVRQHLQSGKAPTRLAMTWKDRVSFILTDTLQIKKISFLDLAFEGRDAPDKDEAFDADAALATGELCKLIPELIDGLGGEHDFFAAGAALAALPELPQLTGAVTSPTAVAVEAQTLDVAPWD